jgi:hypothetical protein
MEVQVNETRGAFHQESSLLYRVYAARKYLLPAGLPRAGVDGPTLVRDDGRRKVRTGERPTPGLVDAGNRTVEVK